MSTLEFYAGLVAERAYRRRVMTDASALIEACQEGHDGSGIGEAAYTLHRTVIAKPDASGPVQGGRELVEAYRKACTELDGTQVKTYIPALDHMIGGIRAGEVMTVVARPRVGKSALASQIALDLARSNRRALFVSLEMPGFQVTERLLMQALNTNSYGVQRLARLGQLEQLAPAVAAVSPIIDRIAVIDRGKSSINDVEIALEQAEDKLSGRPDLVIIDYLGLLSVGSRNIPLYQRVSEAAVDVKSFAKTASVAVLLTCQASRSQDQAESEGAARLGLDSARDSGQIEEGADFMVTMWRPELASKPKGPVIPGSLECCLVKNRRGQMGDFALHIDSRTTTITSQEGTAQ